MPRNIIFTRAARLLSSNTSSLEQHVLTRAVGPHSSNRENWATEYTQPQHKTRIRFKNTIRLQYDINTQTHKIEAQACILGPNPSDRRCRVSRTGSQYTSIGYRSKGITAWELDLQERVRDVGARFYMQTLVYGAFVLRMVARVLDSGTRFGWGIHTPFPSLPSYMSGGALFRDPILGNKQ